MGTMKYCCVKLLLIAVLTPQHWTGVASFTTIATLSFRKESELFDSYLENLEERRGGRDKKASEQQPKASGYKFGDVTRGVLGVFQSKVNSLTGNDTYKFGDFTKWLDAQAKVSALKLDAAAKRVVMERVTAYTKRPDYKIGDITKEVIRRFEVGEYKKEDLWLFVRICLLIGGSAGAGVATALPVKVLLELLEVSMASSVSEDLTSMLMNEINNRMKEFITGDKNYRFGDLTKKILLGQRNREVDLTQEVVGKVTGKEVVEFSALSKDLILLMAGRKNRDDSEKKEDSIPSIALESNLSEHALVSGSSLEDAALKEFEEWEKKYLASMTHTNGSVTSISENDYKSWDETLVRANDRS
jgi:hypothetical protein